MQSTRKLSDNISFIQYYKKASFLSFSEGCKNNFDHCEYCIGCTNGICSKSYMNDLLVEITSSSQKLTIFNLEYSNLKLFDISRMRP